MPNLKRLVNNGNYFYFKDAPIHISGVSLDKHSITLTTAGQTEQLTATVSPSGAVDDTSVTWSSSDTSVATVSSSGLVTCVTPGDCTITVTTNYGGFTDSCTVANRKDVYVDFLLIAGGGGGGKNFGGGGGAGGVIQCCNYLINSGCYPVVVGRGGTGVGDRCMGISGCNSTFNSLIAYGGGGGGGGGSCLIYGLPGGSGGGGGYISQVANHPGGAGCSGQGYAGGCAYRYWSGGGGGAGGTGMNGNNGTDSGGMGGIGIQSDIDGTCKWYAGGGSGHNANTGKGTGPSCGGTPSGGYNCGSYTNPACTNATICGAGGGGTCHSSYGNGGCGIFILRYPTACGHDLTGGCKYTCGSYTIHCFTSSGDLIVN